MPHKQYRKKPVIITLSILLCVCIASIYTFFMPLKTKTNINTADIFKKYDIDYLLVNATNEWLDETPDIKESAVYTLTGFSGDTGDALLYKSGEITLFVDGRYHIQAENEINNGVKLVKLTPEQKMNDEIIKHMYTGSKLGIVSTKMSYMRYKYLQHLLQDRNITLTILNEDPINNYTKPISKNFIKTNLTPQKFIPKHNTLITDLTEVSYLTGLRNFERFGSSKIYAKLFVDTTGKQTLFTSKVMLRKFIEKYNQNETANAIMIDKSSISLYDFNLIQNPIIDQENDIFLMKATKTNDEITALQQAFEISDKALEEIRTYIETAPAGELSEYDIYSKLIQTFYKYGACGLSFDPIVAINKNSASAHYKQHSKNIFLQDGDLVLIDCGVYGKEGLATDTTRVFVKGKPNALQRKVYTQVLKAFLQAYKTTDKTGYEMHQTANQMLTNSIKVKNDEYFEFTHSLGHGIGISVHEMPPSLSKWHIANQEITNNMCFTIEPGLYHKDFFGIRLENSFYRKNNKNISFNKIGFESKLIIFEELTDEEKELLKDFGLF